MTHVGALGVTTDQAVNGGERPAFLHTMAGHLEAGSLTEAADYLQRRPADVRTHAMELIDAVMIRLMDRAADDQLLPGCIHVLSVIARIANRKEALICLLEKAEMFKEDVCFKALLAPLQIVLLREPTKRGSSLAWAVSTLYTHLAAVPLPQQHPLEGRQRLLMYHDPDVRRHTDLLHALTPFFQPFVEEISPLHVVDAAAASVRARELLCCYLFKCLDRPLACLDLAACGDCVPAVRASADQLMAYVSALQSNVLRLFALLPPAKGARAGGQHEAESFDESALDWRQEARVSAVALGTFMYLLCAERVTLASTPAVLCPAYLTRISLPLCVTLLRRRQQCAVHKGALLLRALLARLSPGQLGASQLDASAHADLTAALINVSVFSQVAEQRQLCVRLLTDYVSRFCTHGRYLIIRNLLNSNHNPSVLALVTGMLKQQVAAALSTRLRCPWFTAPAVTPLLRAACRLPSGATTDLLENHNQLMAALNLVRFLLARDADDECGLRARTDQLREEFLEPLRTALDLSRGHFRLRVRELCEGGGAPPPAVELTVGGQTMAGLTADQQRQTVQLALTTLDLIGTVLGWVGDAIAASQRTWSAGCTSSSAVLVCAPARRHLPARLDVSSRRRLFVATARSGSAGPASASDSAGFASASGSAGTASASGSAGPASAAGSDEPTPRSADGGQGSHRTESEHELRTRILEASLPLVPEHGWSADTLAAGAESLGLPDVSHGMFPRGGVELVHHFYISCNSQLAADMADQRHVESTADTMQRFNTRELVRWAVERRLRMVTPYLAQWPDALALLMLPHNLPASLANLAALLDDVWYYAGDRSSDFNWYTKRATLAAVYKATELRLLTDTSEDFAETWAFLDRRLQNAADAGRQLAQLRRAAPEAARTAKLVLATTMNMMGLNSRR